MTLTTCTITIAGLTIDAAYDGKQHYLNVTSIAAAINYSAPVLTRQLKTSESLKALAGRAFDTTIKQATTAYVLESTKTT